MEIEPELVDPLEGRLKLKRTIKNTQFSRYSEVNFPTENPTNTPFSKANKFSKINKTMWSEE